MLHLWEFDYSSSGVYGAENKGIKLCFIFAIKNNNLFHINENIEKIPQKKLVSINELYEMYRNDEPLIYCHGGNVFMPMPDAKYKYFAINFFAPMGEYKKGDLIASLCLSTEPKDWRDKYNRNFLFEMVLNPKKSKIAELKLSFLKYLHNKEASALAADKQEKETKIQDEEAQRNAEIQKNWTEKMRLARENEALKERLEIEKRAEEEKNRILAERLEAQKRAMEEETRLTREILEMRERIERQDLEATAKTFESIRDLFGKK